MQTQESVDVTEKVKLFNALTDFFINAIEKCMFFFTLGQIKKDDKNIPTYLLTGAYIVHYFKQQFNFWTHSRNSIGVKCKHHQAMFY